MCTGSDSLLFSVDHEFVYTTYYLRCIQGVLDMVKMVEPVTLSYTKENGLLKTCFLTIKD